MMQAASEVTAVAEVIQLAVAPVFLLSATGAILAVMTSRLGRIIDRARRLEEDLLPRGEAPPVRHAVELGARLEIGVLTRRARLIGQAIAFSTATAVLVCLLVIASFIGAFVSFDASFVVALLFIAAMLALSIALILFLNEISIATATMRFGARDAVAADLEESGRPR
jgi:hypothetical protein